MTDRIRPVAGTSANSTDALLGQVLNERFRIDALIARGGMGCVYRAERLPLGTPCALKVVTRDDMDADAGNFVQRFAHEAALTAGLSHPNCVSVIEFGQTPDGILYLAMELLEGNTLAQALRADGPFPVARFLRVATQICAGVQAAHALGIVHRDLKTANIFLVQPADGPEFVKVLDFGIAKRPQDAALAFTRPGQMLGTPTYMAPEQILERPIDTRADIYSLGVIFFELLVGRPPFHGTDFLDVLAGHAREPVPLMAAVRPDILVPAALEAIVRRMLAKTPEQRYADLGDVLAELARIDASTPAHAGILRASAPFATTGDPGRPSVPDAHAPEAATRVSRLPPAFDSASAPNAGTPGGAAPAPATFVPAPSPAQAPAASRAASVATWPPPGGATRRRASGNASVPHASRYVKVGALVLLGVLVVALAIAALVSFTSR